MKNILNLEINQIMITPVKKNFLKKALIFLNKNQNKNYGRISISKILIKRLIKIKKIK